MDPRGKGQRGARMGGGGGGGRRPQAMVGVGGGGGGGGMGGSFGAVVQQQQPLIRLPPPQQVNSYMELGNRRVEYANQGVSSFRIGGTYQGVPAHATTIPSLSSGQGFYTVESLQGASMLLNPGIPAPSLQNRGGGGGLGVGVPPVLPKPYSALHLNASPLQYSAAEKNEDGIGRGALLPKPYSGLHSNARTLYGVERKEDGVGRAAPLPKPYSAMHLNTRPQYGAAEQIEDRSYMDMDRERQRYNGHGVYTERPGPPLPYPNSPGFSFGWPAEREQAAVVERPKGRDFGRDREKGRKRDVRATERFQGRGSEIRRRPTIPGPLPPPLAVRTVLPMKFKPKKKPVIVLGPGGTGWCELCELECKTANMLQQHLVGKRHRRNVLKRESEADLGSQNANGSKPSASGSSENASGLGKHIATEPPEDDTVLKKQRIIDDTLDLSTDAVLEQCEHASDAVCKSSDISTMQPLLAPEQCEQASDAVWKSSDASTTQPLLAPEQCEQASDVVCKSSGISTMEPLSATEQCEQAFDVVSKSSDISTTEPLLASEKCEQASDAVCKYSNISTTEPLLAPEQYEQASDTVCKYSNISTTEPLLAPEQYEQASDAVCKSSDISATEPLLAPEECEQTLYVVCKSSDISATEPLLAPEECEQTLYVVCKSSAVSIAEPLLAPVKSSNGIDDSGTTSNGVDDEGCGDGATILNGDVDGCTTSTTTVENVAKPERNKEDICKTMPPEDLVHIEIGEAVKLVEVSIDNRASKKQQEQFNLSEYSLMFRHGLPVPFELRSVYIDGALGYGTRDLALWIPPTSFLQIVLTTPEMLMLQNGRGGCCNKGAHENLKVSRAMVKYHDTQISQSEDIRLQWSMRAVSIC